MAKSGDQLLDGRPRMKFQSLVMFVEYVQKSQHLFANMQDTQHAH